MAKRAVSQSNIGVPLPLTIREFVFQLICSVKGEEGAGDFPDCPAWPGDVFAVVASMLDKSGAYRCVGTSMPSVSTFSSKDLETWEAGVHKVAISWRSEWCQHKRAPKEVRDRWDELAKNANRPVSDIQKAGELLFGVLELMAFSDEALAGAGLILQSFEEQGDLGFWAHADALLLPKDDGSTLCEQVHSSRARVLPKSQTPKTGLTVRSWSHHLALCPSMDVKAYWHGYEMLVGEPDHCNLLLIPWPFDLNPSQFQASRSEQCDVPEEVGWFKFQPRATGVGEIISLVEDLLNRANSEIGEVHVVVLPELALNPEQYSQLKTVMSSRGITLITGVAKKGVPLDQNYVAVFSPTSAIEGDLEFIQNKHHRWKLDRNQIVRYGLSASMDPAFCWWEGIRIEERKLNFLRMREWLSTCVLVCEDLARLEPVGQYVRSVAPDLVIALLMDGPQLRQRWPAYYATVLVDDPGSSVLTLTSLGMTQLSRAESGYGRDADPVIAMWRDSTEGLVEIRLPREARAAVLTLTRDQNDECTADGRRHRCDLGGPVFSGVNYV